MRIPKWLAVLFFASLALNVGVLAGYAYQSYLWAQERAHVRRYFQDWAPNAERRFSALINERLEASYRIDSLRLAANQRLSDLTYVENPDSAEVARVLDRVGELGRELALTEYRVGRRIHELMPIERRRQSEKVYRKMMGLPEADSASAPLPDSVPSPRHSAPKKGG